MNSKMYVVLIIIWLMYLPRGKITLFEKFHVFAIVPNEVYESFKKSGAKISMNMNIFKKNANILLTLLLKF